MIELLEALDRQVAVGEQLQVAQLQSPSRCPDWTVREVLNHSIGVTRKFSAFASGVTDEPHSPTGDLLGSDHRSALRAAADEAREAWTGADLSRRCRLSFGAFPAELAAGINLFDVLAHTWDVASAVGIPLDEGSPLWGVGLESAQRVIGASRDERHYGPELPGPQDATPMVRFLAFLGREPDALRVPDLDDALTTNQAGNVALDNCADERQTRSDVSKGDS